MTEVKRFPHFIAVEGCIGSGKTTLANLLAKKYKGKVLLEATKKHPFIRDFYLKPEEYAFQTEMNFILIHYHQLLKAKQRDWFKTMVISDFLFDKDLIFASLTLRNPTEFKLFKNTFYFLKRRITKPDIVLYLRAPTDFLFKRIKKRRREFERNIPLEYLKNLNEKYDNFFNKYCEPEIIVLDAIYLDYKVNKNFLERVIDRLDNFL